ncbi:hypothetical protein C8R46DRAFT_1198372 [Mycena filopes]|nr:hypothetical protein C8R46DRAFT_1198372 [Mycena filopes]
MLNLREYESAANLTFKLDCAQFIGPTPEVPQPIKGRTFLWSASRIQTRDCDGGICTEQNPSRLAPNKQHSSSRTTTISCLPLTQSSPIPGPPPLPLRHSPPSSTHFEGRGVLKPPLPTFQSSNQVSPWLAARPIQFGSRTHLIDSTSRLANPRLKASHFSLTPLASSNPNLVPRLEPQPTHFSTTPQTPKPRPSGRGDYARLRRKRRVEKAEIIAFSPHKGILGHVTGLVDGAGSVGRRFT